jgi:hypothetical protein
MRRSRKKGGLSVRIFASVCVTASLLVAPSWADQSDQRPQGAPLSTAASPQAGAPAAADSETGASWVQLFAANRDAVRPVAPLAPFGQDQLALAWRGGDRWGVKLDLTTRGANEVLPREEVSASAYYQVTPRFRFGGGVSVDVSRGAQVWRQDEVEANVRIESAFSF